MIVRMGRGETADERACAIEWLREIEASAAELVEVGDLLFASGKPSDPALLPCYQLYGACTAAGARAGGCERRRRGRARDRRSSPPTRRRPSKRKTV